MSSTPLPSSAPLPTTLSNTQWLYTRHPEGIVGPEHYTLRNQALATDLSAGEVLVAARYISVDPYMRINQSLKPTYNELPHPLDAVQSAGVVGQVLASTAAHLSPRDSADLRRFLQTLSDHNATSWKPRVLPACKTGRT
jgi:NADPH-dependent curcumin reductase CurA